MNNIPKLKFKYLTLEETSDILSWTLKDTTNVLPLKEGTLFLYPELKRLTKEDNIKDIIQDRYNNFIKEKENISTEMANITRNEFSKLYSDWEIKNFSNTDVELYKDFSGNCGEHFLVKSSLNGFVEIYRIKDDGTYELHETTEIAIKYLSDDDRKELENGVILYGKENLNSYIENFE